MALTFRNTKGSSLTHDELDNNFRELYYSSSYTSHSIVLYKSKSLEGEFELPVNIARGPKYAIQVKEGAENLGSGSIATGSTDILFNYDTKDFIVTGSGHFTSNLVVDGTVTAQEFRSELVNSAVIYESGSTKFGDTSDDKHSFTGSLQVEGNIVTDGGITGSDATIDAWGSISSSLAANYKYSVDTSASIDNTIHSVSSSLVNTIENVSSSLAYSIFTVSSSFSTTVTANSSSAASDLQSVSASLATTIGTVETDAANNLTTVSSSFSSTVTANSSSAASDLQSISASLAAAIGTVETDASADVNALSSSVSSTYLLNTSDTLTGNLTVTGDVTASNGTFNNIYVNGTGSFALIESVTGSAKIIGDAYIILNNNTPAERYAGLVVQDSGSNGVTSSLEFDGQTNDWFYEYSDDGGVTAEHGVVMFGPEYNTKGAPTYNTANTILKSNGGHHTLDSNITDDGSTVDIDAILSLPGINNVSESLASAVAATGANWNTNLINIPSGLVSGSEQLPTGIISSSAQLPSGIISSSVQLPTGIISSSSQLPSGIISSSVQLPSGIVSSSTQTVANLVNQDVNFGTGNITGSAALINGGILATGDITAYHSSDESLKDNITLIPNAVDKVKLIKGVSFDWNDKSDHTGHDIGVIAQDIEAVLPEIVTTRDSGIKAVRYEKLVALLIEAVKEQQLQIDELKSKL